MDLCKISGPRTTCVGSLQTANTGRGKALTNDSQCVEIKKKMTAAATSREIFFFFFFFLKSQAGNLRVGRKNEGREVSEMESYYYKVV